MNTIEALSSQHRAGAARPAPWYQHRWPWLLMAGPAAVIVAGVYTTWLAFASSDGLVADDYYKQGVSINRQLARERSAAARGISATLRQQGDMLTLRLAGDPGREPPRLRLAHATRARDDRTISLPLAPDGVHRAALRPLADGRYTALLETAEWRVEAVLTAQQLRTGADVTLAPRGVHTGTEGRVP
jgi:hypothetical protein